MDAPASSMRNDQLDQSFARFDNRNALGALVLVIASLASVGRAFAQSTITLQQGQNAYATIDAKVACCTFANTVYGSDTHSSLIGDTSTSLLVRFAVFQSEGGPVPNGATINSATLSLFKDWGPDAVFKATRARRGSVVHHVACWWPSGHAMGRRRGDGTRLIRPPPLPILPAERANP